MRLSNLTKQLEAKWWEVIIDDRDVSFWEKVNNADLLWIPNRIIISKETLKSNSYELKKRTSNKIKMIKF